MESLASLSVALQAEYGHWHEVIINTLSFFFFFQAEDGIRDSSVTGVQTCALPISRGKDTNTVSKKSARTTHGRWRVIASMTRQECHGKHSGRRRRSLLSSWRLLVNCSRDGIMS